MAVITRPDAPPREPVVEADAPRRPKRRRRWLRRLLWAAGIYVVVCAGLAAVSALFAHQGLTELQALRRDLTPGDLLDGSAADRLQDAESDLSTASALVDGPWMTPLQLVPGVGRQVDAFRSMVAGSAEVTAVAVDGMEAAHATVGDGIPQGVGRVQALEDLAGVADEAAASLAAVGDGPDSWLLPGLSGAAADFAHEKVGLEQTLLRSRDLSRALATLLDGPSTYLLFAANNAEMRSGSGMLLSAGLLTAEAGRLHVTDLDPTEQMVLPQGVGIDDPDLAQRWGFAGPDQDFRNLMLSPRFAPNAELAMQMWNQLGRPPVDGVLTVDVLALEELLEVVGPVNVGFEQVDHTNVRSLLLHDQYTRVSQDDEGQAARRDVLGAVARAVLERFDTSEPDPGALARALRDASAGRHLMLWSADEEVEAAWRGVHVAGDVDPDGVLVSVLNDGNNKLDQYLDIDAELTPADATHGTLRLSVTNTVGPDEPPYISGGNPDLVGGYGIYPGRLAVSFPSGTRLTVADGARAEVQGHDGGTEVLAAPVRIAPGTTLVWEVDYVLGQALDGLRILPSARSPGIDWTVGDRTWNDHRIPSRTVPLP
jgi:hypothetical protein